MRVEFVTRVLVTSADEVTPTLPVAAGEEGKAAGEELTAASLVVAGSAGVVGASAQQLDIVSAARRVVETVGTGPRVV